MTDTEWFEVKRQRELSGKPEVIVREATVENASQVDPAAIESREGLIELAYPVDLLAELDKEDS